MAQAVFPLSSFANLVFSYGHYDGNKFYWSKENHDRKKIK